MSFAKSFVHVLQEVFWQTPVSGALIAIPLLVFSKTLLGELDLQHYAFSIKFAQRGQWWRLLTSPFFHHNPFQLLLNVLILWQCRRVEQEQGSWFVLRYTLVLALTEGLCSLFMLHLIAMGIRARMRGNWPGEMSMLEEGEFAGYAPRRTPSLVGIISSQPFGTKPKAGLSGISLAWVSFMMVTTPLQYFYMLGVFPVQAAFAPVAIILSLLLVEPTHQALSQSAGFVSGLLLALGILQVEPNVYWSACFTVDLALLLTYQYCESVWIEQRRAAREAPNERDWEGVFGYGDGDGDARDGIEWERRFYVPQSLLAMRGDDDVNLPVRFWGPVNTGRVGGELGSQGDEQLVGDEEDDNAAEGGGVRVRVGDAVTPLGHPALHSEREHGDLNPDLDPDLETPADSDSREWDSLIARRGQGDAR